MCYVDIEKVQLEKSTKVGLYGVIVSMYGNIKYTDLVTFCL